VLVRRGDDGYVRTEASAQAAEPAHVEFGDRDRVLALFEGGPTDANLEALAAFLTLRADKGVVLVEPASDGFPWRLDSNLLRDGGWLGSVDGAAPDLAAWSVLPTDRRSAALDVHHVRVLAAEEGGIAEVGGEIAEALGAAIVAAKVPFDDERYGTATYFADSPRLQTQCGLRDGGLIRTVGRAGYLVYGPYVPVAPGLYEVEVYGAGDAATLADCIADVSATKGTLTLAEAAVEIVAAATDAKGDLLARMAVEIAEPVEDLEVRVFVRAEAELTFRCLRIVRRGDLVSSPVEIEPAEPTDFDVEAELGAELA